MKIKNFLVSLSLVLATFACYPPPVGATVSNTTISTTTAYGNGVTTSFTPSFDFRSNSWLTVTLYDTSTSPATVTSIPMGSGAGKFTVTGGNPGTAIVMGTAPTNAQYLVMGRSIPLTQPVVFNPASIFPYGGLSSQLDQVTLTLQNLNAGGGGQGGGSGGGVSGLPNPGAPYDFVAWNSAGASTVNATIAYDSGQTTFQVGDMLQFNGSGWVTYPFTQSGVMQTLNSAPNTPLAAASGGSGVTNAATLTWGSSPVTFTTTGTTNLALPTSGTVITGTATNNNTASTIVKRDSSGNFSAGTVTANLAGNVVGNVTGNVTGSASGTAANVTGVVALGNGGTGQTTAQAAINALLNTAGSSASTFARYDGTNVTLSALGIGDVPQGFSRSKLAQATANTLVINDGSGNMGVLVGGTAGNCVQFNGVAWVSASCGGSITGVVYYGTDSGSANAYAVTTSQTPGGYVAGVNIAFNAANGNTGGATVNLDGIGVVGLDKSVGGVPTALVSGDLAVGALVQATYDGTEFIVTGGLQKAYATGAQISGLTASQAVVTDASKNLVSLPYGSTNVALSLLERDASNQVAASTFTGALVGNASSATTSVTATNASNGATVATSSNASFFPLFAASSSNGNQPFNLNSGLSYNPSTNTLTADDFTGALTGNADTATSATGGFTVARSSTNAAYYLGLFASTTNSTQQFNLASGLTYNPNSNTLSVGLISATTVTAALTGVASGNLVSPTPTQHGVLISGVGSTPVVTSVGVTGQLLTGNTGADPTWQAAPVSTTLTTKGDFQGFSTVNARVPVGSNGQTVIGDSNNVLGVRYVDSQPKNYLKVSADAEVDTSGWATYNDTAKNTPVDCTGGTATGLTFSRSTSSPLRGAGSFTMVQTNSTNIQGLGASAAFTIDSADQAKPLAITYDYNASSTFVAGNGTTAPLNDGTTTTTAGNSDVETFVYDVTNSALIPVTPQVITANGANNFTFKGTFQTAPNSTSYRVCQHVATSNANATGWTFKFDNFSVGPQSVSYGAPVTDWVAYTPTASGFGTPSVVQVYYRRVGDSVQVQGSFTNGTVTAVNAQISLPTGLAIDYTKLSNSSNGQYLGPFLRLTGTVAWASASAGPYSVFADGSTTTGVFITYGPSSSAVFSKAVTNSFLATGDGSQFSFTVPVAGWSSTTQMSNDTDTRVVAAKYKVSNGPSLSINNYVNFDTVIYDTHNAVTTGTGTSWKFTSPVSGFYRMCLSMRNPGTAAGFQAYKNNVSDSYFFVIGTATDRRGACTTIQTVAGDTLSVLTDTATTLTSDPASNQLSIERVSGPSAIAASETVSARYYSSVSSISGSLATVTYATKDFDDHNMCSAGTCTIPVSGKYQISAGVATTDISGAYAGTLAIFQTGTQKDSAITNGLAAQAVSVTIADTINCVAGDLITIRAANNGTTPSIVSSNFYNFFSIVRVGN